MLPLLVMEQTPLKTFPPEPLSPLAPVLVKLVVPLKVVPLRCSEGLDEVKLPLKVEEGPRMRSPVPVRVRF